MLQLILPNTSTAMVNILWMLVFGVLTTCALYVETANSTIDDSNKKFSNNEYFSAIFNSSEPAAAAATATAAATAATTVILIKNTTKLYPNRRYARFLNVNGDEIKTMQSVEEDNEIEDKDDAEAADLTAPLYDIYLDCMLRLSFQCVQRKVLMFLDRLSRLKSFNVIGDTLTVVRTKNELGPAIEESELNARLNPGEASSALSTLIEYNIERFMQNHVLRITLPVGVTASVSDKARSSTSSTGDTIDINITRALEGTTGRGKGDKKMKKIMQMMMTGMMGKMAFMGPMMMMLIKLKAIKALLLSKIALVLSLFQMMKGGKKGGGGGNGHGKEVIIVHDSHGGGGNGHENLGSSAWATGGGGGWSGGGGGGGGAWQDSYSQGVHTGGGDATYAGSDQTYATGGQTAQWGNAGSGVAGHGWGKRSSNDPHWVAYRAYIPNAVDKKRK